MEIVLPEVVAIGIYRSQLAVKNRTVTKNRKTTMFEIELPIEYGGTSYINAAEAEITPDLVICAKPGQIRHTKLPFSCYYIHMMLNDGLLCDVLMDTPSFIRTNKAEVYREIFTQLCRYHDSPHENHQMMIQSLILELVYTLGGDSKRQFHREKAKHSNHEIIEKVIQHIRENLTADLSLETVAAFANLSPIYFHNCFKASTGKTLRQFVEEQRIEKAADLLVTTDWTLTKISHECGFSSQSYFSYAFKRKMGRTPREYTREIHAQYHT